MENGKYIIVIGLIIVGIGLLYYYFGQYFKWIGHLPGDIHIEKENFSFYFPITTMILLSILLNLIWRLFQR